MLPRTHFRRCWLLLCTLCVPGGPGHAAVENPAVMGRSVVRTFAPRDFEAHNQVFTLAEAPSGLLYFAVYAQVLEFDGRTWRRVPIPTSWIRGLAADPRGSIYVGGTDQLGVCRPGTGGQLAFHSLLDRMPPDCLPAGPVWSVVWHDEAAWFSTSRWIARFRGATVRVWRFAAPHSRATLTSLDGELYLMRAGDALHRLEGEEFIPINRTPEIVSSSFVSLARGDARGLLAATEHGRMYHVLGDRVTEWPTPFAAEAAQSGVRTLLRLRDGSIAAATVGAGVLLGTADGHVLERITEASHGLASNVTYVLREDRAGGLWVTTFSGMSRIELGTGVTLFDQRNGRGPTTVFDLVRWRGRFHLGTMDAIYRINPGATLRDASITRVTRPSIWSNNLEVHDDSLLVTHNSGVLRLRDSSEPELIYPTATTTGDLARSVTDPARYFVSTLQGVHTFRFVGDRVEPEGGIAGHHAETQSMLEEADGTLWLGTVQQGFVRVRRRPGRATWQDAECIAFSPGTRGVPADPGWCRVVPGPDGLPLFSTGRGAFVPDALRERLVPSPAFVEAGQAGLYSHPLLLAGPDTIYAQLGRAEALDQLVLGRLVRTGGRWRWQPLPRAITHHAGYLGAYQLFHDATPGGGAGTLWVSGRDALVQVDLDTVLAETPEPPAVQIREVHQRNTGRWGAAAGRAAAPLALGFSREPIHFDFAVPRFGTADRLTHQTRLRGYDETWSEWTPRGETSFTNLAGGPFTFEVRAQDADGRIGPVAQFTFSVAPPWSQSTAAWAAYLVAILLGTLAFVRWRLRLGARERTRLEQLVAERTAELSIAKDAADAANRAKSTFLANMSHELRTPLNGVLGYAQVLQRSPRLAAEDRSRVRILQESGEHLLQMINEVLDLSKIEAGRLEVQSAPLALRPLLRDIVAILAPRAEEKSLALALDIAPDVPERVCGDAQKLRQVLDNLAGNAVKFTLRGSVTLRVIRAPGFPGGDGVQFAVIDTGVGLSAGDQARLFQPFPPAAEGRPPVPGSGLGLAISQRLATLLGGTLDVESAPGRGSTFRFTVPLPPVAIGDHRAAALESPIIGYDGERRRILVVDDVAVNRTVLADLLGPLGFEVRGVAGGTAALQQRAEFRPDLVLLDRRMPEVDGLELARRWRAADSGARTKLVIMSASVLEFDQRESLAAGADDFLPKPFRFADLTALLERHLQLCWRRAPDEAPPDAIPAGPKLERTTDQPGTAEIHALLALAQRGEVSQLRRAVADFRSRHAELAGEIEAYLARYEMEALRTFLLRVLQQGATPAPPAAAPATQGTLP